MMKYCIYHEIPYVSLDTLSKINFAIPIILVGMTNLYLPIPDSYIPKKLALFFDLISSYVSSCFLPTQQSVWQDDDPDEKY